MACFLLDSFAPMAYILIKGRAKTGDTMHKGDFKAVTKSKTIIGFIHLRHDGGYEATVVDLNKKTVTKALDSEGEARAFIKQTKRSKE